MANVSARLGKAARRAEEGPRPKGLPRSEAHPDDRQFVTALARGLEILSCFSTARTEIGGTEIAAMTGLPQPTVWRLCHTMVQLGYLLPVSGDKLRPGIPVLRLGRAALAHVHAVEWARPHMQQIADRFGSATGLAMRDENRMVFVQRCLSEAALVMNLRVGSRLALATSAVGWGFLAGCPEQEREALIAEYAAPDGRWQRIEPDFRRAMEEFAEHGYILNIGAFHGGYNTAAAPVRSPDGRPLYAVSCGGSAITHTPGFLRREVAPQVLKLVRLLEAKEAAAART